MQSFLALLHAGTRGDTATEIAEGLSLQTEQVQRVYKKPLASDHNGTWYDLEIYHKIYIQKDYEVLSEFNKTASEDYNADIEFLDFIGNAEGTLSKINNDIKSATAIENFLSLDKIKDSNLFICSSFFYRSDFFTECPIRRKISAIFFLATNSRKSVGFGEFIGYFNYYESEKLEAKFLEIPYKGNETVITIILPNTIEGLSKLEGHLVQVLQPKNYTRTKVIVRIPDFSVGSKFEIAKLFKNVSKYIVLHNNIERRCCFFRLE